MRDYQVLVRSYYQANFVRFVDTLTLSNYKNHFTITLILNGISKLFNVKIHPSKEADSLLIYKTGQILHSIAITERNNIDSSKQCE